MGPDEQLARERHFIEEMGLLLDEMGGTAMTGRIIGRLLICEPAYQSSSELSDYLNVSRGAVSQATRQLLRSGMIMKVPRPGHRSTYYRLVDDAWVHVMNLKMAYTGIMREQAAKGLSLLAESSPERRVRLEEFSAFYTFFEQAMPRLMDEWKQRRLQELSHDS